MYVTYVPVFRRVENRIFLRACRYGLTLTAAGVTACQWIVPGTITD